MSVRASAIVVAVCVALMPCDTSRAAESPSAPQASIAGTVTYTADASRPWRYGRYYIHPKSGALSEAVVCLSSRSLKNFRPRDEPVTVAMDQSDYRFVPETVAIRAGDRVRFTNSDPALHNVMAIGGVEPLNVGLVRDAEHIHTFRKAGGSKNPVRVGCAIHSQMQAWIFVFDHPFFAVTGPDGKFRFEDVPAGDYTVEMVHPAGGLAWSQAVTLTTGEKKAIEIRVSPDNLSK